MPQRSQPLKINLVDRLGEFQDLWAPPEGTPDTGDPATATPATEL